MQGLVHEQTEFVGDPLSEAKPVKLIPEDRGYMGTPGATMNDLRSRIQYSLQMITVAE